MRDEAAVREKLESFDSWQGDPSMRRRNAMPRDRGVIETLLWVLEVSQDDWDDSEVEV